jgi:hypothetical protein
MNINVFSGLIVNASPDQNICIDSVTQIHGNIFGGKPPYTGINWYPPTGLSDPYSLDPIVNLTIPANYVYVLYAMDANGCTSFDTIRINVYPKLVIDAGHLISMCLGKPVSLNGSSVGGMPNVNFSWDPPDGLSDPHSLKPDITEDTPGTYSYVLTATDANQCIRRDTTTVIIYPNPKVEAGSDLTLCLGEKGRLNGSATDGTPPYLKIEWSPATGLSNPSIFDPVVDLTTPGTYKYYLKVSDLYDCSSTDSVSVIIIGVPPITLSSPTLDFGELDQCSTSKKDSITITDDGTLEILIDSVYFDDGFKLPPPQLPIRLIPGRPAKIYVDFVPSHVGLTTGNLHFLGNPCNVDITIQASGTQDKLLIKKDVTDLDFGKTFTCISVDSIQTMNLTNMGSTQIQFDFTQTGISPPFELVEPNGIVTLDPSLNLAVKVRYHPLSPGNFIEGARIPYIAGSCNDSITFTLTGNYIETNLTALYSKVAFPPIIDCQTFLDTIISVKNTGNVPLRIISVDTFPTFSTTDSLPIIIQPNESKQLAVIFTPQRVGNFTGFVKMKFDLCDVTDTLLLSGSKQGVVFKTTDTLDVGEFVVCRDKIITAFDSIINLAETGTYGMITSMTIDPPFRTNIGEGTHLPVKTTTQYQVYFEPDDTYPDGVITGKMKIIISPCNIEKTINLKARKTNVNISKEADLIFDPRQIGTDSIAEVRFKNTGTANVHVNSMNGVLPPYSIVSMLPAPPVWLAPGDEIVIKVKYSPVKEGVDSTTIVIGCNEPCTFTAGSYIGGQGLVNPPDLPPVDVTVYIPDTQDSTGHKVNIPITITAKKDLLDKKATGFYSEISFNKTILLPTDSTPMGITGTNTRKIILTGGINDTLFLMNFLVSLGDAEETLMTIDSISFTNVRTNITKRNGTFRLMDVCHEGGARLINPEGKLQLLLARPNPVTDNFELSYELIETGRTQLYMVNMTGEKIKMLLDEDIKAHCTNTLTVDTKELPSGSYLVILQTPNMRKSIMIVVMK